MIDPAQEFTFQTETDTKGRFRFFFPRDPGEIMVTASASGYAKDDQVAAVGASEIRLVLDGLAEVEGSVLLPEGADPNRFNVILLSRPVGGMISGRHLPLDRNGRFRADNIDPGEKCLEIKLNFLGTHLIRRIDSILFEPGKIGRDPRIQGIDLCGLVQVVELDVVDAMGATVEELKASRPGR